MKFTESNLYKLLWLIISVITLAIVIARAYHIPVTHDEAATVIHYSARFSSWQIMMFPDPWPNNHILNTLLTKMSIACFGKGHLAIRLPSILSAVIYLWAVWRFAGIWSLKKNLLGIGVLLAFLSMPHMLDFFSICRGYGLSIALVLLSLSFVTNAMKNEKDKELVYGFFIALLASYSNFSSLVYWAASVLGLGLYLLIRKRDLYQKITHITWLTLSSLGYLALISQPLIKMRSTNQFKYWSEGSFFNETLVSLSQFWIDGQYGIQPQKMAIGVAVTISLMLIIVISQFLKRGLEKSIKNVEVIIPTFFLLTLFVENVQVLLMHTPHLSGRVAVFLFPLYLASLICVCRIGLRRFNLSQGYKIFIGLVLTVVFGMHIYKTLDMGKTHLWWYDEYNVEMISYLRNQNFEKEELRLNVNWLFHPSLNYYTTVDPSLEWLTLEPYSKELDKESMAEYYFVIDGDPNVLSERYKMVKQFGGRHSLLQLKQ